MRKKIWRMSEDQFDTDLPQIEFDCDKIELFGHEDEPLESSFTMNCINGITIRGMVYSSNPYVICLNPQFEGLENKIRFKVFHQGFKEGDILTGDFHIICNRQESRIPFVIHFQPQLPWCSLGEIDSLDSFAVLAKENWQEALSLFYQPIFEQFISKQSIATNLLYRGYRSSVPTSQNLEQFLVSTNLKKSVTFELDESPLVYDNVSENLKEAIEIKKSTWGYVNIKARTEVEFVSIEKDEITSDYFMGNSMSFSFYIHPNYMHAGKNYAKIVFDDGNVTKKIEILAILNHKKEQVSDLLRLKKQATLKLSRLYEAYRLKKITTGEWSDGTIEILDGLMEITDDELTWYRLIKIQALIVNKKRQEALWIISDLKKEIEDKKSPQWAYLLYLCTLIEKEKTYVSRLTHEIEIIFREYSEDSRIFWFLLFLREEYIGNPSRKLKAIRQWVMSGVDSIFLYIEAYELFCQDPLLLKEFDDFTIKVLHWSLKNHTLHVNLAMQITQMLSHEKTFSSRVYQIVEATYELYHEPDLLMGILTYLLQNHVYQEKYFNWYRIAVDSDLKLNGLYEAYLYSLPRDHIEKLPFLLTKYFSFQNTLDYEKKALVYANVITYKKEDFALYQEYVRQMERFALEQMRLERMDDYLAIIYQDLLDAQMMDEDVSNAMSKLLFPYKIICFSGNINRVFIYQEQLSKPTVLPVIDHVAYASILSDHYQIFLEDAYGNLFSDEHLFYVEPLMHIEPVYLKLKRLATNTLPFFLNDLNHYESVDDFPEQAVARVEELLSSDEVSNSYKMRQVPLFIQYLTNHSREDVFEHYLLSETSYEQMDSKTISYIMDLYNIHADYDKAYELLLHYNGLFATKKLLLQLISHKILMEPEKLDDFLLMMSAYLMEEYLTSDETIAYMTKFYVGPTRKMKMLWKHADALQINSSDLEERMISQMLYAETLYVTDDLIFESYVHHRPNKMVVEAYLTYWAHLYLLSETAVPMTIFDHLFSAVQLEETINESSRIALVKYYCLKNELSDAEYHILDILLIDCIRRNLYFDFYRKMDSRLVIKYHLYDKVFATYQGKPGQRLLIRYQNQKQEIMTQEMIEMYDGIYVRQFVLFFGEAIDYEILSENDTEKVISSASIGYEDVMFGKEDCRFSMLNRMQNAMIYFDEKELLRLMKTYQGLEKTTNRLFEII